MIVVALLVGSVIDKVAGVGLLKLFDGGHCVQTLSLPIGEPVLNETLDFLTSQSLDKSEVLRADVVLNYRWADCDLEITVR